MADLRLVLDAVENMEDNDESEQNYEDNEDEENSDPINSFGSSIDMINPEELFTPLARLRSYSVSDSVFNRRTITHDLPNILATLETNEDFISAIECITKLSEDLEPSVRVELMEQLPYISHYYYNRIHVNIEGTERSVDVYHKALISVLVKYLTDVNNQVRKTCHMTLVDVMKFGYLTYEPFQEYVMPVLTSLSSDQQAPDDYRTEAVALGCKICKILGKYFAMNHFLPIFLAACDDNSQFHIRKVCASNITGLCEVLSLDVIKSKLLPRFKDLCGDNVWGVRKSCAECFPDFAKYFSDDVLSDVLSPLFSNLLSDLSRWVRIAAFESLGPFISTFADSTKANLTAFSENESKSGYEEDNTDNPFNSFSYWREPLPDMLEDEFDKLLIINESNEANSVVHDTDVSVLEIEVEESEENSKTTEVIETDIGPSLKSEEITENVETKTAILDESENNSENKDTGDQRESLNIEELSTNEKSENEHDEYASIDNSEFPTTDIPEEFMESMDFEVPLENYKDNIEHYDYGSSQYSDSGFDYRMFGSMQNLSYPNNENIYSRSNPAVMVLSQSKKQNVIPQALLDNFLSMTDPSRRQTVDCEIAKHCAYSLPGVAYTLGRSNWHCLKEAHQKLAGDVQWKVRHTIASSIHELAKILGEDLTSTDLVPIFNGFLKDLDEVRIGILRHLSEFLQLLNPQVRALYLYQLPDFLNIDNSRNWRFRSELSKQLSLITELYTAEDINNYICPVALRLTSDRVVAVQKDVIDLIVTLFIKLENAIHTAEDKEIACKHFDSFIEQIITHLAKSVKWKDRRFFCNLCEALVKDGFKLSPETIFSHFTVQLQRLSTDKIVNVRICCARAVRITYDGLVNSEDKNISVLENILNKMNNDTDQDVQYYSAIGFKDDSDQPISKDLQCVSEE